MTLTLTPLREIPLIRPGDDLGGIVLQALERTDIRLQDGDILVFAQKVISKAEGRIVDLRTVTPSPRARELATVTEKDPRMVELVLCESSQVLRAQPGVLIVEHKAGFVCANAGIDHSNLGAGDDPEQWVLLLPEDSDVSAHNLRKQLEKVSGVGLGILIIDSHGRAWRQGTVGISIGFSGLPGLVDLRGQPDLFDYTLRITQVGAGDELAAAASLVMGQAAEGTPVIHVRGFPYPLRDGALKELIRPKEQDLFR
jgi:coenzyme F420-0:L-glutamate ligase/coenzyme F420-1:gamma-L-glutamate ligase